MGMGSTSTWYGAPDCMCDITPFVSVSSFVSDDDSDLDSVC